jgi:hypothetical protein
LLYNSGVKDFAFAEQSRSGLPRHNRSSYAVVAVLYVLVVALLIHWKTQPTRVASAGSPFASMTAYVPGGRDCRSHRVRVQARRAEEACADDEGGEGCPCEHRVPGGAARVVGAGRWFRPVRFGSGGSLSLVKRVQPVYPSIMQRA